MRIVSFFRDYRLYISFVVLLLVVFLLFPNSGRFPYEYQRGRPWVYETLYAPIDIPILKTEDEISSEKEERISRVLPCYDYSENVAEHAVSMFASKALAKGTETKVIDKAVEAMDYVYDTGIAPESVFSSESSDMIMMLRNKRLEEKFVSELYSVDRAMKYLSYVFEKDLGMSDPDSVLSMLEAREYIVPNMVYDRKTTDLMHKNAVNYISPTKGMMYSGQIIVSEGEMVTAEVEQLLDSFRAEFDMSYGYPGNRFFLYLSHFIFAFALVAMIYLVILYNNPFLLRNYRKLSYILLMPLLVCLSTRILSGIDQSLLLMMPYTVLALYMSAFFKPRFVFQIYFISMMPVLVMVDNGMELFFMNVVTGIVGIVSFTHFGKNWKQFVSAFAIFLSMSVMYLGFRFLENGSFAAVEPMHLLFFAVGSFLVVAMYPVVYLLEKIFGFLSSASLSNLADTNSKLLQELAKKAPGTFQHCLQVANLAEAAAREIGADPLLVRVGALYHDIGKMVNPQCFIENQPAGVNYHAGLTPLESAQAIINHVDDGVQIANRHRLPEMIVDFIRTHHGRTQTMYFYNQYCNAGGDPADIDSFTYNGMLPTTKEHVILMMADAIEAASRSMKDYSEESISQMVEKILGMKMNDSQLENADISLKEITMVKKVFKSYILNIYHARIAYPERKKK